MYRINCMQVIAVAAIVLSYDVSSLHPVSAPQTESEYFAELLRISHNELSKGLEASFVFKTRQSRMSGSIRNGGELIIPAGAKAEICFDERPIRITGCKMTRADKKLFCSHLVFQGQKKPILFTTWLVGKTRLFFTFGETNRTRAVFLLNLVVYYNKPVPLREDDWQPQP